MTGKTFQDLRSTAVSRLTPAGCPELEISIITGQSLASVCRMRDDYLHRDKALVVRAIEKAEKRTVLKPGCKPAWHRRRRESKRLDQINWLGNLDSNQDRRSQSPLFYH